jgi:hypothetical protein
MSKLILAGAALAVTVAGLGCGPRVQPKPEATEPAPPDPAVVAMERKRASAKYQQELVMAEVGRTHPVLSATLERNLPGLQAALGKAPGRVNEVRRDLHLGPPLREACRLRWKEGIDELLEHGAKCLGDSQCEACARAQGGATGTLGERPRQAAPGEVRPAP